MLKQLNELSFTKLYFLDFLFFSWILGKVTKIYDRVYEPISISKAEIPHQKLSEDNLQVLIVLNFITCSTDIVQILLFLCSILHVFSPFIFFASFFFDLNLRSDVSYPVLIRVSFSNKTHHSHDKQTQSKKVQTHHFQNTTSFSNLFSIFNHHNITINRQTNSTFFFLIT